MRGYRFLLVLFSVALLFAAGAAFGDERTESVIGVYLRAADGRLVPVCRGSALSGDFQCVCEGTRTDAELERCLGLAPRSLANVMPAEPATLQLRHRMVAPSTVP